MKNKLRLLLGASVVVVSFGLFARYLATHRYLLKQLGRTSWTTLLLLLVCYFIWFWALALILQANLRICRKHIPSRENWLLNAYATLVNFFVPGQGGPAVRGLYLKKRYQLRLHSYTLSILLYYACYAIVSAVMLLATNRPWWQTIGGVLAISALSFGLIRWYSHRTKDSQDRLDISVSTLSRLFLVTIVQAVIQVLIYTIELHTVNRHITLSQSITYTGAANFALFVALTPGGIGIRESFLLFSERLHHVSTANVVAASVIDRAIFIVFLGILFLFTIGFHVRSKLALKPIAPS